MSALFLQKLNILHYKHVINFFELAKSISFLINIKIFYLNKEKMFLILKYEN